MNNTETGILALGILAGVLTTGSWIPQALRTIRTRSTHDFSWTYLLMFSTGLACWTGYGIARHDWAVILANVVACVLVLCIVWVKARNR